MSSSKNHHLTAISHIAMKKTVEGEEWDPRDRENLGIKPRTFRQDLSVLFPWALPGQDMFRLRGTVGRTQRTHEGPQQAWENMQTRAGIQPGPFLLPDCARGAAQC